MEILAVVNLRARRGSRAVVKKIRAELPWARVMASRSVAETQRFVTSGASPELVVSAGGDGTAVALLNAIDGELPRFGVLPLGTGNGWARATGAPRWRRAVEQLGRLAISGGGIPVERYDLLSVDGRLAHFAGTGWDAEIIDAFHAQKTGPGLFPASWRQGLFGYLSACFTRTLPRSLTTPPVEVELVNTGSDALTVDEAGRAVPLPGGEHGKVLYRGRASVCSAGTSAEWGFGFRAFPFARLVPGRFCMRVYGGSALEAAMNARQLWRGQHPCPKMHTWLLDGCRAVFSHPVPFQAGGDRLGYRSSVEYRLAERTVDLLNWRKLAA